MLHGLSLLKAHTVSTHFIALISEVAYTLHLSFRALTDPDCDGIEDQDDAIEFAIRTENGRWTPLRLSFHTNSNYSQLVPPELVRGYTVPAYGYTMDTVQEVVLFCQELLEKDKIQFRWMGSAQGGMYSLRRFRSDVWALVSVFVYLHRGEADMVTLMEESFGRNTLK